MADPFSLFIIGAAAVAVMSGMVAIVVTLPSRSSLRKGDQCEHDHHCTQKQSIVPSYNIPLRRSIATSSHSTHNDQGKVV